MLRQSNHEVMYLVAPPMRELIRRTYGEDHIDLGDFLDVAFGIVDQTTAGLLRSLADAGECSGQCCQSAAGGIALYLPSGVFVEALPRALIALRIPLVRHLHAAVIALSRGPLRYFANRLPARPVDSDESSGAEPVCDAVDFADDLRQPCLVRYRPRRDDFHGLYYVPVPYPPARPLAPPDEGMKKLRTQMIDLSLERMEGGFPVDRLAELSSFHALVQEYEAITPW